MSAATDFLSQWIASGETPAITFVTAQRWPGSDGADFKPGIASYGWGIQPEYVKDPTGTTYGLRFPTVYVWFSDRGQIVDLPPAGQQFQENQMDTQDITLTLQGDQVLLTQILKSWGDGTYSFTTSSLDGPSQQLIFSVSGVGPAAPQALMLISFGPGGGIGWLARHD
jgi:hypothetical protein